MKAGILLGAVLAAAVTQGKRLELSPAAEEGADRAPEINRLVARAQPGDEILLRKGAYYLGQSLAVVGKTNLAFRAERDTVLTMRFKADGRAESAMVMFIVRSSADLLFEGFTCTTARPVSGTARVVATDPKTRSYDVRFEGDTDFAGTEPLIISDTCDETGRPDGVFTQYMMEDAEEDDGKGGKCRRKKGLPYTVVSPGVIRLKAPGSCDFARFKAGHRMVYRYLVAGGIFSFEGDARVTVRDVTVWRCPSISAVISPCSSDFTFERYRICPRPGSGAIYASNADGIHVAGMSGTLVLKDCHFEGMGDDPLNVHGKASEIAAWDAATRRVTCVWKLFHRETHAMSANWACAGDALAVYDRATFRERGRVTVAETLGPGVFTLGKGTCGVAPGDILINTRDFPRVRVSGCTVRNIRSRGFLLQSHDVKVTDCSFTGVGGAGILAAPDINNWYESGPTVGLEVSNCRFSRCALRPGGFGTLLVKVNHEGPIDAFPAGVHRDIRISGCTFDDCSATNVCVASARGVCVEKCRLTGAAPVVFVNCEEARWDGEKGE